MKRIARVGATGAALTLASLPLLPMVALADDGSQPTKAQVEYQERVAAAADQPTKAQIEYVERTNALASHPTKAQIEFVERSNAAVRSTSQTVQAQSSTSDSGDAAVWQLAVSAAAGALLTGGVVLASRSMGRHRHALSS